MRIALDAVGGDHAPREIILGAKAGLQHLGEDDQLLLFGPQERVERECRDLDVSDPRIDFVDCPEIIEMTESPIDAIRSKRKSSIVQMAGAAGKGEIDALISAGNTGAFAGACQLRMKLVEGVSRAGIAVMLPTFHGPVIVCDVGANAEPKAHHLYDYARLCSIYARVMLNKENPEIALVSIGEEETKGNTLIREARRMMKEDPSLNFIGFVEGQDIFAGSASVFICDGFTGNVVLKLTEGLAEGLFQTIFTEIKQENPDLAVQFQPVIDRIWQKHDFAEHGGAPLLGVNKIAIICHGRSDQRAIGNAIRVAAEQIRVNLNAIFANELVKGQTA